MTDTIFALATAPGRAGIAVVRVSGPLAGVCAAEFGADLGPPRKAMRRRLTDRHGQVIDDALVVAFAAPQSFTGEEVVEFHLHGSRAVIRHVETVLAAIPGVRQAEAGEFTRRALLNGKLDLAQVEGLGDLLAAETAAQAHQAVQVMEGHLSRRAEAWRAELIRTLAALQACIDFSDEDLPDDLAAEAAQGVAAIRADVAHELAASAAGERLRLGFEVAIVGRPNVGKSTLLNHLAGREAAITSEHAGTTRDVIEVCLDLDGLPVTLLDTAGLRNTDDPVEQIGVARSRVRAEAADLRLFLVEGEELDDLGVMPQQQDLVRRAKADVGGGISGRTGAGVAEMLAEIARVLGDRVLGAGLVSHERQRRAVATLVDHLVEAEGALRADAVDVERAVAALEAGARAVDFLLGEIDVEAVLDVVFGRFCIGK